MAKRIDDDEDDLNDVDTPPAQDEVDPDALPLDIEAGEKNPDTTDEEVNHADEIENQLGKVEQPEESDEETPELSLGPASQPSSQPLNPQLSKYQAFLDDYKRLQDQRRKSDLVNGLIAAGGKIGQSMAGKYSGNFNPDQTGNKMLEAMANRPVQDFEQGQVVQGRGMQLQAEMAAADPNSPQSKLVRDYVQKRLGIPLSDNVSAADAQMLLKTVGRPIQTKFQKVNGTWTDPDTGIAKRMSAIFDPGTGTYKDADSGKTLPGFLAEGLNPFQMGKNQEGQDIVFNKSRGGAPSLLAPAPDINNTQNTQVVYQSLTPKLKDELNKQIVPNFNKLTEKTQQRLMHQAPIQAKLDEAKLNPAAYAQLQAELARFDVGDQRLAQQEFNMFATRHGYKGWADWVQKNTEGTISADFADDFAHTINNTVRGMQQDLNNQAEKQASLLINRLPPGQRPDPKLIAPLIYSGYSPVQSTNKRVIKKGYNSSSNQTQLIYDDGSKEIVNGRQ